MDSNSLDRVTTKMNGVKLATPSPPKQSYSNHLSNSAPSSKHQPDLFNVLQKQHFKLRRSSSSSSHDKQGIKPKPIKNKGLNVFAVSPSNPSIATPNTTPVNDLSTSHKTCSTASPLPQVSEVPNYNTHELRYDLPLPSQEQLVKMDIDEQLRLLALKEMCIVEIKDSIVNLNTKLSNHESELHNLREIIQKSLYQELTAGGNNVKKTRQRQNSNPREEAIASTRKRSSGHYEIEQHQKMYEDSSKSKLWTGLAKPLNYLQQFDNLLQNEFEKSLSNDPPRKSHQSHRSEDSISSVGSASSPLRTKSRRSKNYDHRTDDMMQTVSSSIWSFVNDVKTNVLSSLNETEGEAKSNATYNLDNGSAVSLNKVNDDDDELLNPVSSDNEHDEKIDFSMYKR